MNDEDVLINEEEEDEGVEAEDITQSTQTVKKYETDWNSIYKCTFFMFCGSLQVFMFMQTLWPLIKEFKPDTTAIFYGVVVATFSLSQILTCFIIGWWSSHTGSIKTQLVVCNAIPILGNLLLFFMELFKGQPILGYLVMVSRIFAGIGWGQVPLVKAYTATASLSHDRSRAQAWVNGGVSMGIIVGQALQIVFVQLAYPGPLKLIGDSLTLNVYNAPALFAIIINCVVIAVICCWFTENYVDILQNKGKRDAPLAPYDRSAVATCFCLRFTHYFVFTCLETIGSPFAMLMFNFDSMRVIFWEGVSHTIRGVIMLVVYIFYLNFDIIRSINERLICLFSLLFLLFFFFVTYSWPFLPDNVPLNQNNRNSSAGCDPETYDWCFGLSQVNVYLYYGMVSLLGIPFPNINVAMNTLFSRIIGPRNQSREQGWLEMCGGFGRLLGPLTISVLYHNFGPRMVWRVEFVVLLVTIFNWVASYQILIPLKTAKKEDGDGSKVIISIGSDG